MTDPLGELSRHLTQQAHLPAQQVVQFASALRAAGLRWADIASACGVAKVASDLEAVQAWSAAVTRTFRDIQSAVASAEGSEQKLAPLSWSCMECQQEITDTAPLGRPMHANLGHDPGCSRLARDQAVDDEERRAWLPTVVTESAPCHGPLRRHRLTGRFIDDCPRCGWHGYFDTWAATIDENWARLLCDNCYADLSPDIEVRATFYSCSTYPYDPGPEGPFAVIRQRSRSDEEVPDTGQMITWEPFWQETPILVEEARGTALCDVSRVNQRRAEQIMEFLGWRYWPDQALRLPWAATAYPS
jgi:hypothetical protein